MAAEKSKIIYTLTDEAPLLATAAFLPIIRTFTAPAAIEVAESDISVAARILGEFSDLLPPEQRAPLPHEQQSSHWRAWPWPALPLLRSGPP